MEIEFKLERRIGALSENPSGYTYTKYDLRTWNPNGKPGKGITLTKEELKKLHKLIGEEIRQMGGHNE
ncbi:YdbC family protein [Phascolarctobacterium succinatutens]